MTEPDRFDRPLGLLQVTASGVAIIVGAGIFVLLGTATERAGGLVWLSFIVAAVLCGLTALGYMELSSMYPRAGSEFEFTRQAFPQWVAFAAGWAMAVGLVVAASTVALGFAQYAGTYLPIGGRIGALLILGLAAVVVGLGMGKAAWIVVTLAVLEVGGLLGVVGIGVPSVGDYSLIDGKGAGGVFAAAALIFFAFIGFDEVITLAEETRNPRRNVPLALALSLGISTVIYVLASIAAVSVLGPERLATSPTPVAEVMAVAAGDRAGDVVAAIAIVSTASTVLLVIAAASRMLYGMASGGAAPAWLGEVHRRHTPRNALAVVVGLAALLVLIEDVSFLAEATNALLYGIFVLVNVVVIVLRRRRPDVERPFRIPVAIGGVPLVPLFGIVATLAAATQLEIRAVGLAVFLVTLGLLVRTAWLAAARGRGVGSGPA